MFENIATGIGGIGMFLIGMTMLTAGLRRLAARSLRRALLRFTMTPLRGAAAGALTTAMVQSSSATTVTAVGFVSAGLLTFPQALGVIFGANIGTTITGWLVAIVGFKLSIGQIALLLVFAGALLRLFGRRRLADIGWTLAGFGMLFVGLAAMQAGLAGFEGDMTPADFPGDDFLGRLRLVGIGIAITVITQSSSAGVAAALVALGSGTISFPQAAALVIGMDIGTTFTALLATVGGSTATRQTGYAHVIYNLLTGAVALVLLTPFASLFEPLMEDGAAGAQIALVGFHTTFNTIGVIVVLPFTGAFARLIQGLVPERGPPLTQKLDIRLTAHPAAAVDAAVATVSAIDSALRRYLLDRTGRTPASGSGRLTAIASAIEGCRRFLEQIGIDPRDETAGLRYLAAAHALDHLDRLARRCSQDDRIDTLSTEPRLRRLTAILHGALAAAGDGGVGRRPQLLDRVRTLFRKQRHDFRNRTIRRSSQMEIDAETALRRLEAVRWLHRVSYHLWRISQHVDRAREQELATPDIADTADDPEDI